MEDLQTEAEIQQVCPECGNQKMWFYTLQIRSADEGVGFCLSFWVVGERGGLIRRGGGVQATVFYRCEACGHRFNTNN